MFYTSLYIYMCVCMYVSNLYVTPAGFSCYSGLIGSEGMACRPPVRCPLAVDGGAATRRPVRFVL